jgi:Zn-dependent M28 family amino/carboxypeptidase
VDPLQKAIDDSGKAQPAKSLGLWKYRLAQIKEPVAASNLAGLVPGTDPKLKNEIIVVSAHHDHLGHHEGKVYYGADDNGSGTSGILELARQVAHAKPKRTILFLSVSGEENGLLGSAAFLAAPPLDLARIKADINLDMIGRGKDEELHVTPAKIDGAVTTLTLEARKAAEKRGIALGAGAEAYWTRSDHYNFVKKGIPALFFFAGMHEDYHQPTDTVDKINFAKMARIVGLSKDLVLAVANAKETPLPVAKEVYEAWTWGSTTTAAEPRAAGF